MSNLLIRLGIWIASKGLDDLSDEYLTVENAEKMRSRIVGYIVQRYAKAAASKRITSDEKFWWFWSRVLKSERLSSLYANSRKA